MPLVRFAMSTRRRQRSAAVRFRRRRRSAVPLAWPTALAAAALVLGGCSGGSGTTRSIAPPGSGRASTSAVSLENCGHALKLAAPPKRVVTMKQSATEMLLALGLADRIVGTAFLDDSIAPAYADDYAAIPVLSDKFPTAENFLAAEPDFAYSGWESGFSPDAAGDRGDLQRLGIETYVSPAACEDAAFRPKTLTFDDIAAEMRQLGRIFAVPDRAEALVREQRRRLADVDAAPRDLDVLWYSSGSESPYVGGDSGAPGLALRTVGVRNVFADIAQPWASVSWEEIVARDPDVIVLVDAAWNTAAYKRDLLAKGPATRRLRAVRENRYITVPFSATPAGVRTVEVVEDLAEGLSRLDRAQ